MDVKRGNARQKRTFKQRSSAEQGFKFRSTDPCGMIALLEHSSRVLVTLSCCWSPVPVFLIGFKQVILICTAQEKFPELVLLGSLFGLGSALRKDIYNPVYNIDIESERQESSVASMSKVKIIRSLNIAAALNPVINPNFFVSSSFPSLATVQTPLWKTRGLVLVLSNLEEQCPSGTKA